MPPSTWQKLQNSGVFWSIITIAGLGLFYGGIYYVIHSASSTNQYLASSGQEISAHITNIQNARGSKTGAMERLVAQWTDPATGKGYTFFSDWTYDNLDFVYQQKGTEVNVYLDPTDYSKYYVDVPTWENSNSFNNSSSTPQADQQSESTTTAQSE